MSSGDKNDPYPFSVNEANKISQIHVVYQMMRRHPSIDSRDYDIPYLAGYSKDWTTKPVIYIDRNLPKWNFKGKPILANQFLILHEQTEKALIDALTAAKKDAAVLQLLLLALRMKNAVDNVYYHCHGVATAMEMNAVKLQYGQDGLDSYNGFMRGQILRASREPIRSVPADLDMTPYQGNDAEDKRLRTLMLRAM